MIVVALFVSALVGTPGEPARTRPPVPKRLAALLADERLKPFLQPDRVEALPVDDLLSTLKPGEAASDLGLAAKFRVLSMARPVANSTSVKLQELLTSPRTYEDAVSGCSFSPSTSFRYWRRDAYVDVLLGNQCHQVAFATSGRELLEYFVATDRAAGVLEGLAREAMGGHQPK
jgi:hypothetical protein